MSQRFEVDGLTCGHCVGHVCGELKAVSGVSDVVVDLVPGGTSTVTVEADRALSADEVRAALSEAGSYTLVGGAGR